MPLPLKPSACLAVVLLAACSRGPEVIELSGSTKGTTYHITVVRSGDRAGRDELERGVNTVLDRVDRALSTYEPSSEISRFNRSSSTDWIPVSDGFYAVVAAAMETSRQTSGAFDITVTSLLELWGFDHDTQVASSAVPAASAVRTALERTGYGNLGLRASPRALRKRFPELRIDVDAIAPGYAVDRIAAAFDALGIDDYIVELGGEVYAHGRSPQHRSWRVAIEEPETAAQEPHAIVDLDDRAVSTSGDYRDARIVGGQRVSHTIDPHTGLPVAHDLTSVSVLHESTMLADAYATALMVMGPEAGLSYARQRGLAALFIVRNADGTLSEASTRPFERLRRYTWHKPVSRY